MKSYTTLINTYTDLSLNTSAGNVIRGQRLLNDAHRRFLEKYFFNESSTSITTIGGQTLVMTGVPSVGETSATLTASWTYASTSATATFANGNIRLVDFTNGSTAITWSIPLASTSIALTTALSVSGIQEYNLPYDYSLLKTGTLSLGSLKWTPVEILTRREWDELNTMQLYSDIPNNFYIYAGKFNLWPIPSTTGNIITFNYKKRVPDLSLADYITGTVALTNGSTTVTGSGTAFLTTYLPSAGSVLNMNLYLQVTSPKGMNTWYKIDSITSDTVLTLVNTYQEATISGASYTIGQMPLLLEDYHDVLIFDALVTYYTTINLDKVKAEEFRARRAEIITMMDNYVGKKSLNVNLSSPPMGRNPNLYQNNIG